LYVVPVHLLPLEAALVPSAVMIHIIRHSMVLPAVLYVMLEVTPMVQQ